jgi:ElaB/YqjD/DUF883 family membrane-anchored ribosome-binding protein
METTFDPYGEELGGSGRRPNNEASDGASDMKRATIEEIRNLIADVEDLIERISGLNDADIARVRSKVLAAVEGAKETLADGAATLRRQAHNAMSSADDYVRENPWPAIGLAALVGAVAGILVSRR